MTPLDHKTDSKTLFLSLGVNRRGVERVEALNRSLVDPPSSQLFRRSLSLMPVDTSTPFSKTRIAFSQVKRSIERPISFERVAVLGLYKGTAIAGQAVDTVNKVAGFVMESAFPKLPLPENCDKNPGCKLYRDVQDNLGKVSDDFSQAMSELMTVDPETAAKEKERAKRLNIPEDIVNVYLKYKNPVMLETVFLFACPAARAAKRAIRRGNKTFPMQLACDSKCFRGQPTFFDGVLEESLELVQFRNSSSSTKWWTTIEEANKMFTMDDVKMKLALLEKFGGRTQVAKATIPAGSKCTMLFGKAGSQMQLGKLEFKAGGAMQYRIYNFDPKWIQATRNLLKSLE